MLTHADAETRALEAADQQARHASKCREMARQIARDSLPNLSSGELGNHRSNT